MKKKPLPIFLPGMIANTGIGTGTSASHLAGSHSTITPHCARHGGRWGYDHFMGGRLSAGPRARRTDPLGNTFDISR